ncbi:DUF4145 domain-containing protein [Flammeovirga sp. OC4]|uniref:DUF4145 domain-containing protein n=1 Tax=Flammeovirga sp. OC4 TaxID=1382345 RepID=UPI0005C74E9F|nr:DUF4145 domain-containing protein [Flammeovirga sp. OC4]
MRQVTIVGKKESINGSPNECPFCHKAITPNFLFGHKNGQILEVFATCPDHDCAKSFVAYYNNSGSYWTFNGVTSKGEIIGREFSDTINEISPSFTIIYNQSFAAEQQNLSEICGVGYRKALEFLIKDYAIRNFPDKKDEIEKKLLGKCINDYIDDNRIKSVSKRAVWLGNDETHYVRKWEGKNLTDMKKLIDLTLHWVEMVALTDSFEDEMPD